MTTWITKKNGRVGRVRQTPGDEAPGPEWSLVPNDWEGEGGDDLAWYDAALRRIPDDELIKSGIRKDNQGLWYDKKDGKEMRITKLDAEPGEGFTREKPLENEAFQNWDESSKSWVADAVRKAAAEKERHIAEKKAAIEDAERRIQRSLIAIQAGAATEEDRQYFSQISAEILSLRAQLQELQ
ncbi:MAG: hypothetical protein LBK05_10315 [Treponema sp.]|jgi:hypothetical protein|nr:hypothetical protein [Treponema sp.]